MKEEIRRQQDFVEYLHNKIAQELDIKPEVERLYEEQDQKVQSKLVKPNLDKLSYADKIGSPMKTIITKRKYTTNNRK